MRCCLHTGQGRGGEDRAHRPLPVQRCPGVSLQTKLHTWPQECSRRSVPVRTPSQAGHMAWDLNGQKTNPEEAAPQEEGPDQDAGALGEWGAGQAVCTWGSGQQSVVSPQLRGRWGPSLQACRCQDGQGVCHSAPQLRW